MTKTIIYIEIKEGENWVAITPFDVCMLGFACPKYETSVWNKDNWSGFIGNNHPVIAMLLNEKNPNLLINQIPKFYLMQRPKISPKVLKEYELSLKENKMPYGLSVIHLAAFIDTKYWNTPLICSETEEYSMKYKDLLDDYESWKNMAGDLIREFEGNVRMVIWLEEKK